MKSVQNDLPPALRLALKNNSIVSIFSHQLEVFTNLRAGFDLSITTSIPSGKTLCYNLAILESCLKQPQTTALLLVPVLGESQHKARPPKDFCSSQSWHNFIFSTSDTLSQVMFKKLAAAIGFGILLTVNPIAIGENNSSNYRSNLLDKSSKKAIDVSKISIGGIKLGMKEKDIIKKFGKPKSRTTKYDDVCYSSYITTWKYDGLEIEGLSTSNNTSKSEVHKITASSSRYPTEKGVKVGDRISQAQKAYSAFLSTNNSKNDLVYSNDAYGGLVFFINTQRGIKQISLLAASC